MAAGDIQQQTTSEILLKDVVMLQIDSSQLEITTLNASVNLLPNGIINRQIAKQITIAPNPSNGYFILNIKELYENTSIVILNSVGTIILKDYLKKTNASSLSREMDLSKVSKGVYFVKMVNKMGVHVEKIIVD